MRSYLNSSGANWFQSRRQLSRSCSLKTLGFLSPSMVPVPIHNIELNRFAVFCFARDFDGRRQRHGGMAENADPSAAYSGDADHSFRFDGDHDSE